MNILINGKSQHITSVSTLSALVESLCKESKHVITELNGAIVPVSQRQATPIKDGDVLELVAFVGGG